LQDGKWEISSKQKQVLLFSHFLDADQQDLLNIWLANKVYDVIKNENNAQYALNIAAENLIKNKVSD